tara:strand:- start:389 stop:763 length:375 start_codon:yes stop_codon:yes gene_type:complete
MKYTLRKFIPDADEYRIEFDDERWIGIDLANEFPNYHIIHNTFGDPFWYYISQDGENTIKKFNVLDLRKKSLKYERTSVNDIVYKIASQSEYDKYNDNNYDNRKLYNMLERLWNSDGNITISAV